MRRALASHGLNPAPNDHAFAYIHLSAAVEASFQSIRDFIVRDLMLPYEPRYTDPTLTNANLTFQYTAGYVDGASREIDEVANLLRRVEGAMTQIVNNLGPSGSRAREEFVDKYSAWFFFGGKGVIEYCVDRLSDIRKNLRDLRALGLPVSSPVVGSMQSVLAANTGVLAATYTLYLLPIANAVWTEHGVVEDQFPNGVDESVLNSANTLRGLAHNSDTSFR
jgi:hypothetical protein